ncbi:MAG: ATP-binding protein, partial [Kurthia sp.]
ASKKLRCTKQSKITLIKEADEVFTLDQIVEMSLTGNSKYAEHIGRKVIFNRMVARNFELKKHMLLMAIINNIVSNAVEAIPQSGAITMDVQEVGPLTVFSIKDTGKGIEKDDLEMVFEPGYTTKYSDKGVAATGIGLSHVQEAIKLLGGTYTVTSSSEGTEFIVSIPTVNIEKGV